MPMLAAILWSLPWILPPLITYFRLRNSRSLDDESDTPPNAPPLVSVIVPARNEARNIVRCGMSILSTTYPNLELIVVDDASTDGTHDIAERAIGADTRARVITTSSLPAGWFGKQWACWSGAQIARGEILQFTDADTVHSPDLVTRSVNAMLTTRADLFSIAGRQELGGFWERSFNRRCSQCWRCGMAAPSPSRSHTASVTRLPPANVCSSTAEVTTHSVATAVCVRQSPRI